MDKEEKSKQYLTIKQAAKLTNLNIQYFYQNIDDIGGATVFEGNKSNKSKRRYRTYRFEPVEFHLWLASRKINQTAVQDSNNINKKDKEIWDCTKEIKHTGYRFRTAESNTVEALRQAISNKPKNTKEN